MAIGRTRADQVFSIYAACDHQPPCPGKRYQAALADRARLPGPQTGTRTRTLRRPRMAGFSPSRHTVHRRLWIPDLRKGSHFPLRTMQRRSHRRTSPIRRLPTPRIPQSDLSATSQTQSRPSVLPSQRPLPVQSCAAHAASTKQSASSYDTVRLGRTAQFAPCSSRCR
jgi:hypothetical protein